MPVTRLLQTHPPVFITTDRPSGSPIKLNFSMHIIYTPNRLCTIDHNTPKHHIHINYTVNRSLQPTIHTTNAVSQPNHPQRAKQAKSRKQTGNVCDMMQRSIHNYNTYIYDHYTSIRIERALCFNPIHTQTRTNHPKSAKEATKANPKCMRYAAPINT